MPALAGSFDSQTPALVLFSPHSVAQRAAHHRTRAAFEHQAGAAQHWTTEAEFAVFLRNRRRLRVGTSRPYSNHSTCHLRVYGAWAAGLRISHPTPCWLLQFRGTISVRDPEDNLNGHYTPLAHPAQYVRRHEPCLTCAACCSPRSAVSSAHTTASVACFWPRRQSPRESAPRRSNLG